MIFVAAAYAHAAAMHWPSMWQSLGAAALCIGALLLFSKQVK
jgi:hypothetical protein